MKTYGQEEVGTWLKPETCSWSFHQRVKYIKIKLFPYSFHPHHCCKYTLALNSALNINFKLSFNFPFAYLCFLLSEEFSSLEIFSRQDGDRLKEVDLFGGGRGREEGGGKHDRIELRWRG